MSAVLTATGRTVVVVGRGVGWSVRWWFHHGRLTLVVTVALVAVWCLGSRTVAVAALIVCLVPGILGAVWATRWPVSFETRWAGPWRRRHWRTWATRAWPTFARHAGLTTSETRQHRSAWNGETSTVQVVHAPHLLNVSTVGERLQLTARARMGQTADDLEKIGPALADAASAQSVRVMHPGPGVVRFDLVMRDMLAAPFLATGSDSAAASVEVVRVGVREDGEPFDLHLAERHTLIVGASGSGKGSFFWGVALGLAPEVRERLAQLVAIDLKFGMEAAIGAPLFSAVATTETDAVAVLHHLEQTVTDRGNRLAGHVRHHTPTPGDPVIVLLIDELAALTAYMSDSKLAKEADRCLRVILTKGRALGVLVVGALQDPRKETIPMRNLFTQTVALRLRSSEETRMVLGDRTADRAPAHKIGATTPGMAYLIDEDGSTIRVRAGYASDALIRHTATRYATPMPITLNKPTAESSGDSDGDGPVNLTKDTPTTSTGTGRKPRKPRQRTTRATDDSTGTGRPRAESTGTGRMSTGTGRTAPTSSAGTGRVDAVESTGTGRPRAESAGTGRMSTGTGRTAPAMDSTGTGRIVTASTGTGRVA